MSFFTKLLQSFTKDKSTMLPLSTSFKLGSTLSASEATLITTPVLQGQSNATSTATAPLQDAAGAVPTSQPSNFAGKTLTPQERYAAMSTDEKVVELEKVVTQQGEYLKQFKEATKILNRRNTLAIIELQKLVRDLELRHPDTRDLIDPVMSKVAKVLDFKTPMDV